MKSSRVEFNSHSVRYVAQAIWYKIGWNLQIESSRRTARVRKRPRSNSQSVIWKMLYWRISTPTGGVAASSRLFIAGSSSNKYSILKIALSRTRWMPSLRRSMETNKMMRSIGSNLLLKQYRKVIHPKNCQCRDLHQGTNLSREVDRSKILSVLWN